MVGTGGLGSPALFYLAAAGVGRLGIVDSDVVELSNLQRQILHATDDLGRAKTESGAATLRALNPDVTVERHQVRFDAANAGELVRAYDVVIDAVDNFDSRFLSNDACVLERKTLVEGAILRFTGLAITIRGGETACYRCLFPREPAEGGRADDGRGGGLRARARRDRGGAGGRSHQGARRLRPPALRPPAAGRPGRHDLHGGRGRARPGLPGVRRAAHDHRSESRRDGGRAGARDGRRLERPRDERRGDEGDERRRRRPGARGRPRRGRGRPRAPRERAGAAALGLRRLLGRRRLDPRAGGRGARARTRARRGLHGGVRDVPSRRARAGARAGGRLRRPPARRRDARARRPALRREPQGALLLLQDAPGRGDGARGARERCARRCSTAPTATTWATSVPACGRRTSTACATL